MAWRHVLGTRCADGWKIALGPDWAHRGKERRLQLTDKGPLDTAEQFLQRLQQAKTNLINKGESAANLVETYIQRVLAAEAQYQTDKRGAQLKTEADDMQYEIWRLRDQADKFDLLSRADTIFQLKNEANDMQCEIRRLKDQAAYNDFVSQNLYLGDDDWLNQQVALTTTPS